LLIIKKVLMLYTAGAESRHTSSVSSLHSYWQLHRLQSRLLHSRCWGSWCLPEFYSV